MADEEIPSQRDMNLQKLISLRNAHKKLINHHLEKIWDAKNNEKMREFNAILAGLEKKVNILDGLNEKVLQSLTIAEGIEEEVMTTGDYRLNLDIKMNELREVRSREERATQTSCFQSTSSDQTNALPPRIKTMIPINDPVQETGDIAVPQDDDQISGDIAVPQDDDQISGDIAVPQDDDQVKQTMRNPCASEDSMQHEDVQSALAYPDLRDKGKIPTELVLAINSMTCPIKDITPNIEQLLDVIDVKTVEHVLIMMSPDQQKNVAKEIEKQLKWKEKVDKSEDATSIKFETKICSKKQLPANLSRILAKKSFSNTSRVIVVCDEDTKHLVENLLDTRAIIFILCSKLAPQQTLSEIGEFIKDVKSVTIYDADNYTKVCEGHIQQNPDDKCLVFCNEITRKLLDKNVELKEAKNVHFCPASRAKKEAADCDIVTAIEYITAKHPHIVEIRVVSDDKIFQMYINSKETRKNSDVNGENPSPSIIILNPRKLLIDDQLTA